MSFVDRFKKSAEDDAHKARSAGTVFYDVALGDVSKVLADAKDLKSKIDAVLNSDEPKLKAELDNIEKALKAAEPDVQSALTSLASVVALLKL